MKISQDTTVVALVEVNQNKIELGKRVSKKPYSPDYIYFPKTSDFSESPTKHNTKRKKTNTVNNNKSAKRRKLEEKQLNGTDELMEMGDMKSELMELSTCTNGECSSNLADEDMPLLSLSASSNNSGDSPKQQRYGYDSSDNSLGNSRTILKLKRKYDKRVKDKEISNKIKEKFPHFDHLEWVSELSYQHMLSKEDEIDETKQQNFAKPNFSYARSRLCHLHDIHEHSINQLRSQLCKYCFSKVLNIESYNIISTKIKERTLTIGLSKNKCNNCGRFNS